MSLESPPRLKHGELGPVLEAANVPVSPERVAANHAAIKAAIGAGVANTWPLWAKLGLPLLLLGGVYALVRGLSHDEVTPPPPPPIVVVTPPDASIDAPDIDAPPLVDAAELDAAPVAKKPRVVVVEPPPPDAAPPPSDLPAQIALYEEARAAAAKGELARGIDRLDELLQRFPSTQLRADAELTRAELLTRTDRLDDAAAALETLTTSPAHRGRRGELLRALGDVRRKQGDCTRAIDAYTRARALKPVASEIAKIDRGLERCAPPK